MEVGAIALAASHDVVVTFVSTQATRARVGVVAACALVELERTKAMGGGDSGWKMCWRQGFGDA
jgi:hypothetical protein